MARTETEQLVFSVEARIGALEKQMARAGRTTDKTFTGMERRSKKAATVMEREMAAAAARVGAVMKNFGAGLLAGLTAGGGAGLVAHIGKVAASIAEIRTEAAKAGVSTTVFQEWQYLAEQTRIPVDSLTDSFKELSIRADEFASTGSGSAAEAFKRLGLTPAEVKEKLKDPADLMLLLIERTRKLGDTAAGVRVFDELFGSGGERMVSLLQMSDTEVRNIIKSANEAGRVMDDELIGKAEELDKRFRQLAQTVGTELNRKIIEAATLLMDFIDRFRAFENQGNRALDLKLKTIAEQRLALDNEIQSRGGDWRRNFGLGSVVEAEIAMLKKQDAALAEQEAAILAVLEARQKLQAATGSTTAWTPPALPSTGGGAKPSKDTFKPARDGFAEMIGATQQWRREQELANQRMEQFGQIATGAGNALVSALADGKLEGEELLTILTDIITQLLSMPGGIAGLLKGLGGIVGEKFTLNIRSAS